MPTPREHVHLPPHCTMRVGGAARSLVQAADEAEARAAVEWAQGRTLPVRVLGGGSNLVIADEGVDGLVLKIGLRGIATRAAGDALEVTAAARALDREAGEVVTLGPAECGFGYRDSVFKRRFPGRHVVLAVTYRLTPGGSPSVRYADLTRGLEGRGITRTSLAQVRETVLTIRRSKSMVLDAGDVNRRSCGSFFLNPI